jgi:hypothetical protein
MFNASGFSEGDDNGTITLNYTDCYSNSLITGTFSPDYIAQTACSLGTPGIEFVSPTPENQTDSYVSEMVVNVSVDSNFDTSVVLNLDGSLIGWWKFDDTDASDFKDHFGRYNGTCSGGDCPTAYVDGNFRKAFDFDGYQNYAYLPKNASFDADKNFSFSIWIKPKTVSGSESGAIVSKRIRDNGVDSV